MDPYELQQHMAILGTRGILGIFANADRNNQSGWSELALPEIRLKSLKSPVISRATPSPANHTMNLKFQFNELISQYKDIPASSIFSEKTRKLLEH